MIRTITLTFILAFACTIGFAQRKAIDSVRHEWSSSAKQDTSQVRRMWILAMYYWTYKPDSALYFAQTSLALARQLKFPKGESIALSGLSLINSTSGNPAKSLELSLKALQVNERNNVVGFEKAFAYLTIAGRYGYANDNSKAISYMQRSLQMFDSLHSKMESRIAKFELSGIYLKTNQFDSAMKYGQLAYNEMIRDDGFHTDVETFNVLNALATAHAKKGNSQLALRYFRQSLIISSKESHLMSSYAYHRIAKVYQQLNKRDSAIYYAEKSLDEAQKGTLYPNIIDAGILLSELYNHKDFQKAFEYSQMAHVAKDSLHFIGNRNAYKNLLDFDEKERQYEIETATASYQSKVKVYSLIAGLGVFLLIAFILYRNNKQTKNANRILAKTLTDLKSTQSQLIQSEKMASLGELTAGIAHEIQKPVKLCQ